MKFTPVIVLTILSPLLLGLHGLAWLGPRPPVGTDVRSILVTAIGLAGLAFAVMAIRELRLQKAIAMQLKKENEGFV